MSSTQTTGILSYEFGTPIPTYHGPVFTIKNMLIQGFLFSILVTVLTSSLYILQPYFMPVIAFISFLTGMLWFKVRANEKTTAYIKKVSSEVLIGEIRQLTTEFPLPIYNSLNNFHDNTSRSYLFYPNESLIALEVKDFMLSRVAEKAARNFLKTGKMTASTTWSSRAYITNYKGELVETKMFIPIILTIVDNENYTVTINEWVEEK